MVQGTGSVHTLHVVEQPAPLLWLDDHPPRENYIALGRRLADSGGIYSLPGYGNGLLVPKADRSWVEVQQPAQLAALIADRVPVCVVRDGRPRGASVPASHLRIMLLADSFLEQFPTVDMVTTAPVYLSDFSLSRPGFNHDEGIHRRILYLGAPPGVRNSCEALEAFLEVMDFDGPADRTNAVAAALTVLLRNHWPGGKPLVLVTATKSHAGKDTVIAFAAGIEKSCSVSYQATNWALERAFVGAVKSNPETGVIVLENARLDGRDQTIASAFVERFVTDPAPMLFSTGTGKPARRQNDIVVAISTNYGDVSTDIANRALPIHLRPRGNVADRKPSIGNPRLEYLPSQKEIIAQELRGMVERWKLAGKPLDGNVKHPFGPWARTIGGILMVNGYEQFLANYLIGRAAEDPVRKALALLGGDTPDTWIRPGEWASRVSALGLTRRLIPEGDRESERSRERAIGRVLSAHAGETFRAENESQMVTLRLEKARRRFDKEEPQVRYKFTLVSRQDICEDVAVDAKDSLDLTNDPDGVSINYGEGEPLR